MAESKFKVKHVPNSSLWEIVGVRGGVVPDRLKGKHLSEKEAQAAIDSYYFFKEQEKPKKAPKKTTKGKK